MQIHQLLPDIQGVLLTNILFKKIQLRITKVENRSFLDYPAHYVFLYIDWKNISIFVLPF